MRDEKYFVSSENHDHANRRFGVSRREKASEKASASQKRSGNKKTSADKEKDALETTFSPDAYWEEVEPDEAIMEAHGGCTVAYSLFP